MRCLVSQTRSHPTLAPREGWADYVQSPFCSQNQQFRRLVDRSSSFERSSVSIAQSSFLDAIAKIDLYSDLRGPDLAPQKSITTPHRRPPTGRTSLAGVCPSVATPPRAHLGPCAFAYCVRRVHVAEALYYWPHQRRTWSLIKGFEDGLQANMELAFVDQ